MATFNSLPAPVTTIEYRSVEVAFLVGKTTIKQIGFPAGLKAVLDVTSPIQQIDQEGVWLTSTAIGTRPNSQLQGGTSSPTFTNNPGVFVPFAYKYGIVQATLPQSMPLSTFEGMTTTAGVYKALTITPDSPQATISSLADLDAFFAADTSVPRKPGSLAFCALGETCGTGFYGMDFIKVVPPTGDITGFTAERRNRITFNANNESEGTGLLTSWDWGQPAYCRAQLAALGFSPADLTP